MAERRLPDVSSTTGQRVLGLDFAKYLLSSDNRRCFTMDSDNATGTESDLSDWELGHRYNASDNSEESDEYGVYHDANYTDALPMFDTAIGSESDHFGRGRQQNNQIESLLAQMNSSNADSGYSGSLYPIQEAGSTMTDSSGSHDDISEHTLSNSGSPIHHPVYGSYHKIQNQIDEARRMESDGSLERLMLHRLPGEYLGMILGIEGGKDGNGTVTAVCVKSVTLGGAAHRATGGSKGVCVGDEIVEVNGLDLHTLTHDECVQVFKDMPLRVMLGIQRGQKDIPAVAISPLPMEKEESMKRQKNGSLNSPRFISPRELSDNDADDGFAGFRIYQVTVEKDGTENLGLSIVPSYGSTKQYYQIKRILPSGSAARSGQLQVGDRLITCNDKSLRGLTQTHCLNIIRTASSHGNVTFEVIRPVYNGRSMEISVTVNPNSQSDNPYNQTYDPQQYSVKSQSYDRHVDVVVTSESEDYLTVSEDEYSKTGRLANIPEVEANEVFASNSVKLAFQKPFSSIEEDSTATEAEPENISPRNFLPGKGLDIIDLNKGDTSPYHIPKKPSNNGSSTSPRGSQSGELKDNSVIPKSDIDTLVSPRSPRSSSIPKTDLDTVSVTNLSPRSPLPQTDLDRFKIRTPSPVSPGRTYTSSRTSYNKRQQVPVHDSESITPPFSYHSESISKDIPTDNQDAVRYNPLYDSNASEATDSDTVQDIYIASPYESPSHSDSLNALNKDTEYIDSKEHIANGDDEENDIALPPPLEFSDSRNSLEQVDHSPVTNIDDLDSSSVDVSPIHQEITIKPSYKYHTKSAPKLENSFRDLEEASTDKPVDIPRDYSDSELAFNNELAAPFDSVLQEYGDCVHKTTSVPVDFADTSDNEILRVVQSNDDGTIVISQFEANENKESVYFPNNRSNYIRDIKMDTNSEAMLKDALDMDYEQIPETSKLTTRIELAGDMQPNQNDFEIELENGRNVIAEKVAKEMLQNEGGNYGYDMECDDEPDQYAGADEPEPELPLSPPPFLMKSNEIGEPIHQTVISINGDTPTDTEQSAISNDSYIEGHAPPKAVDVNWSFRPNDAAGNDDRGTVDDLERVTPVTIKRKVDIPIDNLKMGHEEEEIVVPQKIERTFSAPKDFIERVPDNEAVQTKKKAPPTAPKPSKSGLSPRSQFDENSNSKSITNDDLINLKPVEEHVFSATDVSEQRKKNLVNVISVVNALKAARAHEEPDVVDRVVKVDKKDIFKKTAGAVINVNSGKEKEIVQQLDNSINAKDTRQISPPRNEVLVSSKETLSLSKPQTKKMPEDQNTSRQTSPPKEEVIVTTKQEIVKSKPKAVAQLLTEQTPVVETKTSDKGAEKDKVQTTPNMKTSIFVEKPKSPNNLDKTKELSDDHGLKTNTPVPPLNLSALSSPNSDTISPTNDKSGEHSPSSTYKTTIGVSKSIPDKPTTLNTQDKPSVSASKTPQFKTLSPIKPLSFNPKSLSQTLPSRPVQYKTTINTKPSLGLASSLLNSKKVDHPIKRMETMPFEVSILKGILGIGIKTAMTPEGFVKISEILPSGPVGREGNIKVGDYLLSINGTQLTGLPDSKVQQTLRLLPRGLSKLVASAVPPDPDAVKQAPAEKSKLTLQQSVPLSSLRKTTVTTNQGPTTISTRKPLGNATSLQSSRNEKASDEKSPQESPRSPKAPPPTMPKPKERLSISPRGETSPRSPVEESVTAPLSSPIQSAQMSPRSPPPPIAPKPARTLSQSSNDGMGQKEIEDTSKPIETVILASVNTSKVESSKPGPHILPGSVNYDSIEPVSKTGRKGEVSSAEFKSQNGKDLEGKVTVVNDTQALSTTELTSDSSPQSKQALGQKKDDVENASFEAIVDGVSGKTEVDVALLANRNRSFSTSSDNESYTDFNECNVEDAEIPSEIAEVEENESGEQESPRMPENKASKDMKSDEEVQNTVDKSVKGIDVDAMAANIVAEVITSVKQMDLNRDEEPPMLPIEEPAISVDESSSVESAPPLPEGPPPLPTEAPPPIPGEAPPPLIAMNHDPSEAKEPVVSQLVDLALYPDDIPTELSVNSSQEKQNEVIDVVASYHSAQLHGEQPLFNVVSTDIAGTPVPCDNNIESISGQVTDDSQDQSGHSNDAVEDASVNIVIDMYSDIRNDKTETFEQSNSADNTNKVSDNNLSLNGKSLSSSDIVLSETDNTKPIKEAVSNKRNDIKPNEESNAVTERKLNGHSAHSNDVKEKLVSPRDTRKGSDGGTSLSPRSDSTYSPRTASVTSEDEGHGGRYVPDVDKVIRMLSQSEEPIDKGAGEEMMVTINKGVTGLGFVIEGGRLSVKGDLPISIKRIFKGGPAENHLQVGDEICEVNGEDVSQMRRSEAWNHLKFLPSGDINMKIKRYNREPGMETDV